MTGVFCPDVYECVHYCLYRDHPLTLYVFSQDSNFKNKGRCLARIVNMALIFVVFDNTLSGAAVANDTLLHCGGKELLATMLHITKCSRSGRSSTWWHWTEWQ